MNTLKNRKLFVLVSALVIVLDCTIDILLLRLFWKNRYNEVKLNDNKER